MKTNHQDTDKIIYILVEEEEAIRNEWLRISFLKGISLMTYPDEEWFLNDLNHGVFRGNEHFYFDQDFGTTRGVGLRLSKIVKSRWPNAFTALVTGYPKLIFLRDLSLGHINDVFGKYPPPFENQAVTALEKQYENDVWIPVLNSCGIIT